MSDSNFSNDDLSNKQQAALLKEALDKSRIVLKSGKGTLPPPDILEALVHYCIEEGHANDALEISVALLQFEPFSADAWHANSMALANCNDLNGAIDSIKKALSLNPSDIGIRVSDIMLQEHKREKEISYKAYSELLQEFPGNDEILYALGQFHEKHNNYNSAIKIFQFLLSSDEFRKHALSDLGYCYDSLHDYENALHYYDEYLNIDPYDATVWFNKAVVLCHLERYNDAIDCYDFALAIKADFAGAWYNRGNALGTIGRLKESIESYRNALQFESNDVATWHNLGSSLEETGEFLEAIEAFTMALHYDAHHFESYYGRGSCYDALEKYSTALSDYNKALELSPTYGEVVYAKAEALYNLKRIEESLEYYEHALTLIPNDMDCQLDYAITLSENKEFQKAESILENIIKTKPDWSTVYYEMSRVKAAQNDIPSMKSYLKKSLQLESTSLLDVLEDFSMYCPESEIVTLYNTL